MKRFGHECSGIEQVGQRDTGGIGAQRALMVLMAYGLSRMFSGCSQFSVGSFSDNVGSCALLVKAARKAL